MKGELPEKEKKKVEDSDSEDDEDKYADEMDMPGTKVSFACLADLLFGELTVAVSRPTWVITYISPLSGRLQTTYQRA